MNINRVLEIAPTKIAEYSEKCNEYLGTMNLLHEEYKKQRAKKYLAAKAQEKIAQKDLDYQLDIEEELNNIKDKELLTEIQYRAMRTKMDKAVNTFEAARSLGSLKKQEMFSLHDTIRGEK